MTQKGGIVFTVFTINVLKFDHFQFYTILPRHKLKITRNRFLKFMMGNFLPSQDLKSCLKNDFWYQKVPVILISKIHLHTLKMIKGNFTSNSNLSLDALFPPTLCV